MSTIRVLLVDDDADIRACMAEDLAAVGFEVVEASDGAEAVERLADRPKFDLVVTDLNMPKMNGAELVRYMIAGDFDVEVVAYSSDLGRLRASLPKGIRVFQKFEHAELVTYAKGLRRLA